MTSIEPKTLKGFRDYLPKEQLARQTIFAAIQKWFELYGFAPLSTPALEYKEILMKKYGEDEKLLYSFTDNGGREVAMRYDLTVPLARFIAENQNTLTYPFKRYQIAPVWRADKPQKGRFREFYQCDIDTVGTDSFVADAEVVACVGKILAELGVTDYEFRINDRRIFTGLVSVLGLAEEQMVLVIRAIDKVKKIGVESVISSLKEQGIPGGALDKIKMYLSLGEGAGALDGIVKTLGTDFQTVIDRVKELIVSLQAMGVPAGNIVFDPSIARGLDYYTGMVVETTLKNNPEYGSIASGGRYDNLVDEFLGQSIPAVGISIGIDRLFEVLSERGLLPEAALAEVLVLNQDAALQADYISLVTQLRDGGIKAELYYEATKFDKQFKYAESKGARWAVIMGEVEKASGKVQVKNLQSREQQEVVISELVTFLKK